MQDTALRIKTAVLTLKRFTIAELCNRTGLRRPQVDPVIGELKKQGLLVTIESEQAGESAAHRPAAELELTENLELVRALAGEIYRVRRAITPEEELTSDSRVLKTQLESLELVAEAFDTAVAPRPVERAQLQRAEALLRTVHGHLEAESFKACMSFEELEKKGHPLFGLWVRWQLCTEQVKGTIQRWRGVTSEHPRKSSPGLEIAVSAVPKLQEGFTELEGLSIDLDRMDPTASFVCREIVRRFPKYELCSIQRIRPDSVIETVVGEGLARGWVGLSKHRVAREQSLRDIQADIVLRQRAEVIRSFDPRLDAYLYKRFEHAGLVRIFVPLVIFRNSEGALQKPPHDCWQVDKAPEAPHGRLVLTLKQSSELVPEVFGTVEAGFRFKNEADDIGPADALKIAAYVTENAALLYRHSLDFALERVVERIRELANGDSAVLHLLGPTPAGAMPYALTRRGQQGRMIRFGPPQPSGGIGARPRATGIGQRSVKLGNYIVFPDRARGETEKMLETDNPDIFNVDEVRTLVAFPLNMGPEDAVAYVHYLANEIPDEHALQSAWMLTKRSSQVFGTALEHDRIRDTAQQMTALNRILMHLVAPRENATAAELGEAIVWNTHNFLAADVVTLYEFDEEAGGFTGRNQIAGRLKNERASTGPVAPDDARWLMLDTDSGRIFADNVRTNEILNGSHKKDGTPSFNQREEIESTAAIVLKADGERVGVLFANFRAPREFNANEQDLIARLAEGCAVALKTLRATRAAAAARRPRVAASPEPQRVESARRITKLFDVMVKSYEQATQVIGPGRVRDKPTSTS